MTGRGTTNTNDRGSASDRRARKWYLLAKFESPRFGAGWTHCYRCEALLSYVDVTVDRILPGCLGGTYRRDNIRPACSFCNSSTGSILARRMGIVPREGWEEVGVKIDEQVRQMEPRRYTRRQAAQIIGKDLDTLKRWKREGTFVPQEQRKFGSLNVDLYSEEDITALRQIAKTIKPGRRKAAV